MDSPFFQCDRPGSTPAPPRSSQANDAWHPRRDALLVEIQGQELRTVDANERLDVAMVAVGGTKKIGKMWLENVGK